MKSVKKDIAPLFNRKAAKLETDFLCYLEKTFDSGTARKVIQAFQKMSLPLPQSYGEFLHGTEGGLVFLNRYGVVIRIEGKKSKLGSEYRFDRINNSPWILKPLASIDAGRAVIEICPGCHPETNYDNIGYVRDRLREQNINYWDARGFCNSGRVPVKTPSFPKGVPVVIDRLAVRKLTGNIKPVRLALKKRAQEAAQAQEKLYGPLRKTFKNSWPNAPKMARFWALCQRFVQEGKLIAGWNESEPDNGKAEEAIEVAGQYEIRLNTERPPAISQSPRPG